MGTGRRHAQFITRMNTPRQRGWKVYVPHCPMKYFKDSSYGEKDLSLEAAEKHRDILCAGMPQDGFNNTRYTHNQVRKNSSTAQVGVSYCTRILKNGTTYEGFIASYQTGPFKTQKRQFSITKHGREEAYRLACEARDKGEKEVEKQQIRLEKELCKR